MNVINITRTEKGWGKDIHNAIRQASKGDVIILSGGKHPGSHQRFNKEILLLTGNGEQNITQKEYRDLVILGLAGVK